MKAHDLARRRTIFQALMRSSRSPVSSACPSTLPDAGIGHRQLSPSRPAHVIRWCLLSGIPPGRSTHQSMSLVAQAWIVERPIRTVGPRSARNWHNSEFLLSRPSRNCACHCATTS